MKEALNNIILKEIEAIEALLKALEDQHNSIVQSDAFAMEASVGNIEKANKKIAEHEMERRQLTKGEAMSNIVDEMQDKDLDNNYRKIKRLLQETVTQKNTNDLLIKQGLGFTNRMLNILNPQRGAKTYNSYGKVHK